MNDEVSKEKIIIDNMLEGVIVIGFNGLILLANPAAMSLLGIERDTIVGVRFSELFFNDNDNNEFVQVILDAIMVKERPHYALVPYKRGDKQLHFRVMTSFFVSQNERKGIVAMFGDLSELMELRDAVKSMEVIQELNSQLESRNRLLSETFGRFLSDDIVKKLLDTPGGLSLGGKKEFITVMMSDLRGFTVISEDMDAADMLTMLNHYLGCMTEIIQAHRGTIIEFIGDGIMAVFGAPTFYDSHAADAVSAALCMQNAMAEINSWNRERGYPELEMGIGINTGDMIVGNIGSEKRTKYGVAGSNVNICGRIESYTVGGQVLIPQTTMDHVQQEVDIESSFMVYPKGLEEGMELFEVRGISGPDSVSLTPVEVETDFTEMSTPVKIRKIVSKHGSSGFLNGTLVGMGEKHARLETDAELSVRDDLQLETDEKFYCKVVKKEGNLYTVRFTSRRGK